MAPPVNNLLAALARHPNLDPKAVLAVARQEGLGGGIGDQGTSFGPFQLHYGGAYPSSAPHGQQASHAWAWSPQGIEYALSRIASVAGGLHGAQAVGNIVSRFERPADPSGEIARALAAYGGNPGSYTPPAGATGGGVPAPSPASAAPVRQYDPRILAAVLSTHQALGLPPPGPGLTALLSR